MEYEALKVLRRLGAEPFHSRGAAIGVDLLSFWQWACSDLCGNALRGIVSEFLVAHAIGATERVRVEWDAFDVTSTAGLKIEVKTSGYLQSWKQKKLSAIKFDIAPKLSWDAATNTSAAASLRSSNVFVFAVHAHNVKETLDALDVAQWEFYLLPTQTLNEKCPKQKTIALSSLLASTDEGQLPRPWRSDSLV